MSSVKMDLLFRVQLLIHTEGLQSFLESFSKTLKVPNPDIFKIKH